MADLESQAQRIIAYCGLPWDERCLSFRIASATQVRKPIYRSAVGRWRAYEDQLEPLLTALSGLIEGDESDLSKTGMPVRTRCRAPVAIVAIRRQSN